MSAPSPRKAAKRDKTPKRRRWENIPCLCGRPVYQRVTPGRHKLCPACAKRYAILLRPTAGQEGHG